jgi:L-2-hydroxyglutarate oxidase LhgO
LSVFIEGEEESREYMLNMFDDWQAKGITSVLHEKKGGYANNTKAMYGLANKVEALGVRISTGVEVTGFTKSDDTGAVTSIETSQGSIGCDQVVIGAGPWVRDFWDMLNLPKQIEVKDLDGNVHQDVDMWRFWQLEEGVLRVDLLQTNDGKMPPVLHVDTDAPL